MATRPRRRCGLGVELGARRQNQISPPETREEKIIRRLLLIVVAIVGCACAPGARRIALPIGSGTPTSEYAAAFSNAMAYCRTVQTLQAELSLSGNAGNQRLRGRALAGFAPGALRLEALAPFGSPAFILVADGSRGTLLLPRDHRILQDATPEDILNALIGVALGPDDLLAVLSGCVKAKAEATSGRQYGTDWMSVDLGPGDTVYLHLQGQPAKWQAVAGRYAGLEIEYPRFAAERPAQVVIRSPAARGGLSPTAATDVLLTIGLNQVEVNGTLPRDELVAVKLPPALQPITLDELRDAGPLGQ